MRDIELAHTQASVVSVQTNKTSHHLLWIEADFIDLNLNLVYTQRQESYPHLRPHLANNMTTGMNK